MSEHEQEFSFKGLFIPLTTLKAIHWIVIIGLIVYANMLFNGFVFDDLTYIINNPLTHQLNLAVSFGNNLFNSGGQYRPLPATYFSLLFALFGTVPFFYHLLQLTFHICCTLLFFFLFRKYIPVTTAFLLTLVFAVHPIQVESVSFIGQTVSPIFTLFGLLALFIFERKQISDKAAFTGFLMLLLSLLTKETGVLFIVLCIFSMYLFYKNNLRKVVIVGVGVFLFYLFIRIAVGHVSLATRPIAPIARLSLYNRILNMPAIIFYYLKTVFVPMHLAIDQQWTVNTFNYKNFYLPLFVGVCFLLLIAFAGIHIFYRNRLYFKQYLFFLVWFLFGLGMHLQLFPLDMTVADRWFYFPFIGLLGLFGIWSKTLNKKALFLKKWAIALGCVLIVLLSIRTIVRNTNWRDPLTLYTHDIRYSDNFDLNDFLGVEYSNNGNYDLAIKYLQKSVQEFPYEVNLQNLGANYLNAGKIQKAKDTLYRALNVDNYGYYSPHQHDNHTYYNLSEILICYDDPKTAAEFIQKGLTDYPDSPDLWRLFAYVSSKLHRKQDALHAALTAYSLDPSQDNTYVKNAVISESPLYFQLNNKLFEF